jgi:hypothetical protein
MTPQFVNSKYPSGQTYNNRSRYNSRSKRHFVPGQQQQQRYNTSESTTTTSAEMRNPSDLEFTPQALNFGQALYLNTPASNHSSHMMMGQQCCSSECGNSSGMVDHTRPLMDQHNMPSMYSPPSLCSPMGYDFINSTGSPYEQMQATPQPLSNGYEPYGCSVSANGTPLLPSMQFPLAMAYNMASEYDTYDENGNLVVEDYSRHQRMLDQDAANLDEWDEDYDGDKEQLACYVCRGRRMCFCYFLKVRYYKFPSFLDLVDHQYKKWKSSVVKARKAAAAAATSGVTQSA